MIVGYRSKEILHVTSYTVLQALLATEYAVANFDWSGALDWPHPETAFPSIPVRNAIHNLCLYKELAAMSSTPLQM